MSIISASTTTTTALQYTADTTGALVFKTGATPTTALTINADQTVSFAGAVTFASAGFTNLSYTGTLTGGTGVVNIGSGQIVKTVAGRFGIGYADPQAILHVQGPTSQFLLGYLDGTNSYLDSDITIFRRYASGAYPESMRIDSAGNVGIGTSSPSEKLHVVAASGNAVAALLEVTGTSADNCQLRFKGTSGLRWAIGNNVATGGTGVNFDFYDLVSSANRMRIDSSGNVGIGTSSPSGKLDIQTGGSAVSIRASAANAYMQFVPVYGTGASYIDFVASGSTNQNARISSGNGSVSNLIFSTGGATLVEAMRIDSIGNVGIGTSIAVSDARLVVSSAGAINMEFSPGLAIAGENRLLSYNRSTSVYVPMNVVASQHKWLIAGNEAMRITSGGSVLVNQSAAVNGEYLGVTSNGNAFLVKNTANNGTARLVYQNGGGIIDYFYNYANSTNIGSISNSTTSVTYNTSSDYRLKENIAPMTGALGKVALLKPCTYKWKIDGSSGQGFIAHELQAIIPEAVTGEKDAVDKHGKPAYQGIDTSFLVATLAAAIQELKAEFDEYKATHP